tara:strand:+ start:227 stop:454 length:228 start_codon:yes stop_codon:yes gene_type:complete
MRLNLLDGFCLVMTLLQGKELQIHNFNGGCLRPSAHLVLNMFKMSYRAKSGLCLVLTGKQGSWAFTSKQRRLRSA